MKPEKTKAIRYVLDEDVRYLYTEDGQEYTEIPWSDSPIFCDILDSKNTDGGGMIYNVRAYQGNDVFVGWTPMFWDSISLWNQEELFDGRFNKKT